MSTTVQHRDWSSSIRLRLARATLALAIVLVPAVLATRAQAQTYTVLYVFTGWTDGCNPTAGLVRDTNGNLYGTASVCGRGGGTVFKLHTTGTVTVLHEFGFAAPPDDGANPAAGLFRDAAGNLYGTTVNGGGSGLGAVFEFTATHFETVLHSFAGYPKDGAYPYAGLIRDSAGNFYGTTHGGGAFGDGVVFKLSKTGKETVLYSFHGTDGANPYAGLVRDAAGNLYGTTVNGGTSGNGVVFKLDTTGKEIVLYSFTGGADGGNPYGGLVRDAAGNLYGTTNYGNSDNGVVFKLDTTGKETVLYSFTGGADGGNPYGGLVRDAAGNLYGTTVNGGTSGNGVVFKLDTSGKETVLHSFGGEYELDGAYPTAGLLRDAAGNLYGTAASGGEFNQGVVFKLTP